MRLPDGLASKESATIQRHRRCKFDLWLGRGNGKLLQYSCLKNPTDRRACGPAKELDTTEGLSTHTQENNVCVLVAQSSPTLL